MKRMKLPISPYRRPIRIAPALGLQVFLVFFGLLVCPIRAQEPGDVPRINASTGRLHPLPKLSETELDDLLSTLRIYLETELAYSEMSEEELESIAPAPRGITDIVSIKKDAPSYSHIQLGLLTTITQPPRLWLKGILSVDGEIRPNPDLDIVITMADSIIPEIAAAKEALTRSELSHEIIQLDYIDLVGALEALKGFGFTTFSKISEISFPMAFSTLPVIAPMPQPTSEQTALLGQAMSAELKGAFELSVTPSVATALPDGTNMSPSSQLAVIFHPAHPDQYSKVVQLLQEVIDRPARQIFVEGLVLEISEEGLKELGVEWQFNEGNFAQTAGSLATGIPGPTPTLDFSFDDLRDLDKNWVVKLRSLISSGKAEILSRPSVLTLNNRQATIRVGTDIPIATAQEGVAENSNKISFNFKYLATGISLNIRPRITASGEEVGMLIDTIVSSIVPGGDLELRSSRGEVLASAPTVATRRVQTYARIENNTPFIIGGLVSKELTQQHRKVPLLAEIPYLGKLFRSSTTRTKKREVIIVLTPYVLVNDKSDRALGRFLPKDEDRFDEFGNVLFRDFYRIRNEDVFDLGFLTEDSKLLARLSAVQAAIAKNRDLIKTEAFEPFRDRHVPGEEILVQRMIYEVIKRLSSAPETGSGWLSERASLDRIILFERQNIGGYEVAFLDQILTELGDGNSSESFFTQNPGKALEIRYVDSEQTNEGINLRQDPIPTITVVECPDEQAWTNLIAKGNRPTSKGLRQSSFVLHNADDVVRLRRAVLLDKVIQLNGGRARLNLQNFSLGKVLLIPEPDPEKVHLLDPETARYFYHTEHYYAALLNRLTKALEAAESQLK
jgi:general secretion pathway protein D